MDLNETQSIETWIPWDFFIPSQNEFDSDFPSFSTFSIARKEIYTCYIHIYTYIEKERKRERDRILARKINKHSKG